TYASSSRSRATGRKCVKVSTWGAEFSVRLQDVVRVLGYCTLYLPCGGDIKKTIRERFLLLLKLTKTVDTKNIWDKVNRSVFVGSGHKNLWKDKFLGLNYKKDNQRFLFILSCLLLFCQSDARFLVESVIKTELRHLPGRFSLKTSQEARSLALSYFLLTSTNRLPLPPVDPEIIAEERVGHKYKLKPHKGAGLKVNIHASEVIAGCKKHAYPVYISFKEMSGLFVDMFDDQVAAALLYSVSVTCDGNMTAQEAMCFAVAAIRSDTRGVIADLSDLLKMLALAAWCPYFVELKCLQGRGVAEIDVLSEAKLRLKEPAVPYAYEGESERLRLAVRQVFNEELKPEDVRLRTKEDFWSSRWLWAANGGHSRALEHAHPELRTRKELRAYRKCVLEQWKNNPMDDWDGKVFVTPSQKLEHGKSRLLLACDTLSYLWFEYFLKPVETAWANKRTLLNPGVINHYKVAKDFEGLLTDPTQPEDGHQRDDLVYSLDFEDFNSQHSLTNQKLVFEELFNHIGLSNKDTARLVKSFDQMIIYDGKSPLGRVRGTLMSGHRATTFINTVLNTAYLLAAGLQTELSYHVGDDVIFYSQKASAEKLYDELSRFGVRCNPHKQCASEYSGEFLRVAHTKFFSSGYVSRAIASCVSGNWVSDHVLDRREALTNAVACVRTILNRTKSGYNNPIGRVVALSVAKRCCVELQYVEMLLYGRACLSDGVVYGTKNSYVTKVDMNINSDLEQTHGFKYETNATTDYLRHHTSTIESVMLKQYGADIAEIMAQSSWMKSMEASSRVKPSNMRITFSRGDLGKYVMPVSEVGKFPVLEGVFERYPLLMMIKERIPLRAAIDLARSAGFSCLTGKPEELWGSSMRLCSIDGYLPYADACQLACRIPYDGVRIVVDHNVYT
ncbi:RNA-dependent RNA polymerase, partial [Leishmaniavirus sani]